MSTAPVAEVPSGLQWMEAIRDGVIPPPPAAELLGLEIAQVSDGGITFVFTGEERFSNGATVHGGVLAAVADFALSSAVFTAMPPGVDVVTTNLAVSYLRPVPLEGRFRCTGRLIHRGRTLAHAEAVMTSDHGRELLRATATFHRR